MSSNVRIEIVPGEPKVRSGKSKKTGNDYEMRTQEAYLHNGHTYPDRFEMDVPQAGDKWLEPYAPGFYTLAPGSVQVNREFGRLELNRFEMKLLRLPDSEQGQYATKPVKAAS